MFALLSTNKQICSINDYDGSFHDCHMKDVVSTNFVSVR